MKIGPEVLRFRPEPQKDGRRDDGLGMLYTCMRLYVCNHLYLIRLFSVPFSASIQSITVPIPTLVIQIHARLSFELNLR